MAIEDILSLPETFTVDGKEYKAEFDCRSYGVLESLTGKSIYKIQELIASNNLFMTDSIEVICASLIKNHTDKEINTLREHIKNNLYIITQVNLEIICAFFKGISAPEVYTIIKEKVENDIKKKIETEV